MNERISRPPFDNFWRERLKDYPQTEEFQRLFNELKQELILPERKLHTPIAVSMIGIPGSGKSTFSKLLQEFIPALHLRTDIVGLFRLPKAPDDDYYKAYVLQQVLAEDFLEQGYSVIMDDNNRTRYNREQVYKLAQTYNAQNLLFQLVLPLGVAAERANTRDKAEGRSTGGMTIPQTLELVRSFHGQIEDPTEEELNSYNVIYKRIDAAQPVSEIRKVLQADIKLLKLFE